MNKETQREPLAVIRLRREGAMKEKVLIAGCLALGVALGNGSISFLLAILLC